MNKRAQNKETLTIKQVVESIKAMHIMMHGAQIGTLMEYDSVLAEKAMVVQTKPQSDPTTYPMRNGKPRLPEKEYNQKLRDENAALKNQVKQLLENAGKTTADPIKTSIDGAKGEDTRNSKPSEFKRKREQAKKVTPLVPDNEESSPPSRVSGFMLAYSTGEAVERESDEDNSGIPKATAYIARVRVPITLNTSNVENEKPADPNIQIAAPSLEGTCTRSKRRCLTNDKPNPIIAIDLQAPEGVNRQ